MAIKSGVASARQVLKHVLARCCVAWLVSLLQAPASAEEATNVVLLMADDLGWGDVGFNGGTEIHTPNLDAMADNGLNLTRFYALAPVCSPTRGSCLTGRHPDRYGIGFANVGHLPEEEITLAEVLKEHGYRTGHFGKWHLGTLTKDIRDSNRGGPKQAHHFSPPQMHGFDVCFSTEAKVPTYDPMFKPSENAGSAWDSIQDLRQAVPYGTRYWNEDGQVVHDNLRGDDSQVIMDRAIGFIEHCASSNEPFFTVVWFHAPHLPVVAGPRHRRLYIDVRDVRRRNYYACVTALDEQIGRLRQRLAELRLSERTLIAFCSDNGPEGNSDAPGSAGPYRGRKRSLLEGGVRVPALVEWPSSISPGTQSDFPAATCDYLPTVLNILDIPAIDDRPIDGVSLLNVMLGEESSRSKPIIFQSRGQASVSSNQFKLIRSNPNSSWQLFNLTVDPQELVDLSSDHPDLLNSMISNYEQWLSSVQKSVKGADYR